MWIWYSRVEGIPPIGFELQALGFEAQGPWEQGAGAFRFSGSLQNTSRSCRTLADRFRVFRACPLYCFACMGFQASSTMGAVRGTALATENSNEALLQRATNSASQHQNPQSHFKSLNIGTEEHVGKIDFHLRLLPWNFGDPLGRRLWQLQPEYIAHDALGAGGPSWWLGVSKAFEGCTSAFLLLHQAGTFRSLPHSSS